MAREETMILAMQALITTGFAAKADFRETEPRLWLGTLVVLMLPYAATLVTSIINAAGSASWISVFVHRGRSAGMPTNRMASSRKPL